MTVLVPTPAAPPPQSGPSEGRLRRWKWTGDDLIRMGEAGLLPPEAKFELLDGEIYERMPPGPLHSYTVTIIGDLLRAHLRGGGSHVREEKPIRLNPRYDPQPDLAVVRGPRADYRNQFPVPEDVLLVVEVADSSVGEDRELKLPAYAEAGIPECWLVNLPEQHVEVYRDPSPRGYRTVQIRTSGETIEPQVASLEPLAVGEVLGATSPAEGAG
jgi:Uma2 family endonuclease